MAGGSLEKSGCGCTGFGGPFATTGATAGGGGMGRACRGGAADGSGASGGGGGANAAAGIGGGPPTGAGAVGGVGGGTSPVARDWGGGGDCSGRPDALLANAAAGGGQASPIVCACGGCGVDGATDGGDWIVDGGIAGRAEPGIGGGPEGDDVKGNGSVWRPDGAINWPGGEPDPLLANMLAGAAPATAPLPPAPLAPGI